jgi:hypothetical protein
MTGMDFSGVMVIAWTGQYMLHRWHIWQSAGYLITALWVLGSSRITSVGQVLTQVPQPMQPLIELIDMLVFLT